MSNKRFQYDFSKEAILKELKDDIRESAEVVSVLKGISRVEKKSGGNYENLLKNFTGARIAVDTQFVSSCSYKVYYTSGNKYCSYTMYPDDNTVEGLWSYIQRTIQVKEQDIVARQQTVEMIENGECGIINELVELKAKMRELGDSRNPVDKIIYYALYNYLS